MFDPELLEMMAFDAVLRPPAGGNLYGEGSYGDAIEPAPKCHIRYTGKQVYGLNKMVRTEEGVCYLGGVFPVTTEWSLEIPVPGGTRAVEIISVAQYTDGEGFHHTTVSFGAF